MLRETAAVLIVAALGVGCGARAAHPTDRVWVANARGVVAQLRGDVVAVAAYDRVGTARQGLHDESQLYGLLVPYADFESCHHMVATVGVEPPGLAQAGRLLRRACLHLQHADELFTRAVAHRAPRLLVDATHEAIGAVPSLEAAALELAHSA
ncbi:MAG TPA: hypothetical protein VH210_07260 [Gaiellaceae bacterium]|nr:hypothetical protein [Gaiellaceae bacterium]